MSNMLAASRLIMANSLLNKRSIGARVRSRRIQSMISSESEESLSALNC